MACHRLLLLMLVAFFALAPAMGLATTIYDVQYNETNQGTGDDCYPSTYYQQVVTVSGIVTAVYTGTYPNFWLQDPDGTLWCGVYFFDTTVDPERGDSVTVTASIDEYYGLTEAKDVTGFTIHSTGNDLPDPLDITTEELAGGCSAYSEAFEGVLIRLSNVVVTQEANQYGEWYVDDGTGQCQVDDDLYSFTPALGDTITSIVGVVDYSYSEYELLPRDAQDLEVGPSDTTHTIYDVQYNETNQGSGDDCYPSPLYQQSVTISGIVIGVLAGQYPDFWLEEPGGGLWNGVFVYDVSVNPSRGDSVTITATPDEYFGLTEMKTISSFTIHSSGNPLPPLLDITTGDLAGGCNAHSEAYEGILVRVQNVVVTQEVDGNGQWFIDDGSGACEVDDDFYHYEPTLGDTFAAIIGIVDYSYGAYEILPRDSTDIQSEPTGVESAEHPGALPGHYNLSQNYPNPFNPETEIRYAVPERAFVRLEVFNLLGQKVATLADGSHAAGEYSVRWNGSDDRGIGSASGIYFYRLQAGEFSATRKMIFLK